MKAIFVLLATIFLSSAVVSANDDSAEEKQKLKHVWEACATENGIELDTIPKKLEEHGEEEMKNLNCFAACVMRKLEILDGNKVNFEKAAEEASKYVKPEDRDAFVEHISECEGKVKDLTDECEVAGTFHQCLHEHLEHFGAKFPTMEEDENKEE